MSAPVVPAIVTASILVKVLILKRSTVAPEVPEVITKLFVPPKPVRVVSDDHSFVLVSNASAVTVKLAPEAKSTFVILLAFPASDSLRVVSEATVTFTSARLGVPLPPFAAAKAATTCELVGASLA